MIKLGLNIFFKFLGRSLSSLLWRFEDSGYGTVEEYVKYKYHTSPKI